jgi:transposase-like protein
MTTNLSNLNIRTLLKKIQDEDFVQAEFENWRWPNGIICPHCGNSNRLKIYKITPNPIVGTRRGLKYCGSCRKQFTATVGTIFHGTHVPVTKWLLAMIIFFESEKKHTALTLQKTLGVSGRTALFMARRLRCASKMPINACNRDGPFRGRHHYQRSAKQTDLIKRKMLEILTGNPAGMSTNNLHSELKKIWPFIPLQSICSILGQDSMLNFIRSGKKWKVHPHPLIKWPIRPTIGCLLDFANSLNHKQKPKTQL